MTRIDAEARLSTAAADMYVMASMFALALGTLSWDQYLLRLLFIRDSAQPGSPEAKAAEEVISAEDFGTEEDWLIGEPGTEEAKSAPVESQLFVPKNAEPPFLHFVAAASIGLSEWTFHIGDADFFPSIPHGHGPVNRKRKLDAYRGWVYQKDRQIRREPRWKIIVLWNDEKFRSFATRAIQHYIENAPTYVWPVRSPLRLPRRR